MLESPRWSHRFVLTLLLSALLPACAGPAGSSADGSGYEIVHQDLEPFRSAFNAASGDVRAVLLVGPT